jgi:hypothetical protein
MNITNYFPSTTTMTQVLLLVNFVALCIYDLPMALNDKPGDTISEQFSRRVTPNPFLMFVCGLIIGHLLLRARAFSHWSWGMCHNWPEIPWALGLIISQIVWAQPYKELPLIGVLP